MMAQRLHSGRKLMDDFGRIATKVADNLQD